MAHRDVWKIFKQIFPMYAEKATEWFPNGKDSIRIRIDEVHTDFIFTFHSNKDWRFETVNSFLKTNKGEK